VKKGIRIRLRTYLMILPLVIVVLSLMGVFATLLTREALTRLANRHMAYKAEQLRDFFFSEWNVLSGLGLDKNPDFRPAMEKSFRSYAFSLLRSQTELIVVFDTQGYTLMEISLQEPSRETEGPDTLRTDKLSGGWFSENLLGKSRVGVAFDLAPVGWKVAVTELESAFFSDVSNIERSYALALVIAVVIVAILLTVYIGYIVRPVERLTRTIEKITKTYDLTQVAEIEFSDEIGTLARVFNTMLSTLHAERRQMKETTHAEREARHTAAQREEEALFLLGRISDFRDEETGRHLHRIGALSALFSALLGQTEEQQRLMMYSAPLHDIGKIGIPDAILHKPSKLNTDEFETIKQHTTLGYELLKNAKGAILVEGAGIALTHHENWDGSGYPAGLKGEDIPLSGRIVAISDTIDTLLSVRTYKEAWDYERVIDHLVEQRGKQFDPRLVDLFRENFPKFREAIEAWT
jgi:response regulator RpfG family c-di-GMP phosphodiesterase